jgi:hypothetical protein
MEPLKGERIEIVGYAVCKFDVGPIRLGDYAEMSSSEAGACHDLGATLPSDGLNLPSPGRVLGKIKKQVAVYGVKDGRDYYEIEVWGNHQ